MLENICLNTCLNKLIYQIILDEKTKLEDLVFIDKPLYTSLTELRKMENVENLGLYYVIQRQKEGKLITEDLVVNGESKPVKDINDYIEKRLEHLYYRDFIFLNELKYGLFSVIPERAIKIFNSNELELVINGRPYLDVSDWKANSVYYGELYESHRVTRWFWEIVSCLTQDELSKFLQFCTGSSRAPLEGFSALESNRGEIAKFCVTSVVFTTNKLNFIRAHTCFNRIDMPLFPCKELLANALNFILKNEIQEFWLD